MIIAHKSREKKCTGDFFWLQKGPMVRRATRIHGWKEPMHVTKSAKMDDEKKTVPRRGLEYSENLATEILLLSKAWVSASKNTLTGVNQNMNIFWNMVFKSYNVQKEQQGGMHAERGFCNSAGKQQRLEKIYKQPMHCDNCSCLVVYHCHIITHASGNSQDIVNIPAQCITYIWFSASWKVQQSFFELHSFCCFTEVSSACTVT